ncbi:MAG: dihydrodipicolinate synthase family protein [Clostridia bacterium]|nr:dihydrodipicolinate synthase family protein [Clostridia bacterium]
MKTVKDIRMVAVTVTPFSEALKPDLEEIARDTERICLSDADAILPCASTGEAVKMDFEDRVSIFKTVAEVNKGRKKLIAGACETSAQGTERDIAAAASLGFDACLVCPPYYYGQSQKSVTEFFGRICRFDEKMSIFAYHVPFFTTAIEIPTFTQLLNIPNLVGLKDSSANMKRIAHLVSIKSEIRPDFRIYTGTDDILLPALTAGCAGSMTALGASMPGKIASIYRAFDENRLRDAMALQASILPIIREADRLTFPRGYKLLAKACGMKVNEEMTSEELEIIETMKKMLEGVS